MGAVVGAFWQVLVMFGLHWAVATLAITDAATAGSTTLLIGMLGTTFARPALWPPSGSRPRTRS